MNVKSGYQVVAEAVRIEQIQSENRLFVVFEITDEKFKKRIKDNWLEDIDLKVIDKSLVEIEE